MKKNFDKFILAIFLIIIVLSISYILKSVYDIYISKNQKKLLNEQTNNIKNIEISNDTEKSNENITNNATSIVEQNEISNNEIENESDVKNQNSERISKLQELQKENSDIKAWIEIENTDINYPVLQGKDNSYYMKHNYKKQYSINGSIFLDKGYSWEKPSCNLLIYGHNNKNGTMFQSLLKYSDKKYFDKHPTIRFTTNTQDLIFEIFAVFKSRVYYKNEQNVFRYYYFIDAKNEAEFNDYVNNSKQASLYDTKKTANYGDRLLTLSTCSYHVEDGRFVIVAKCSL